MKNYLLAERYAGGLVESLAPEDMDAIDQALHDLVQLVHGSDALSHVLYNEAITLHIRLQVLREVMEKAEYPDILVRLGALLLRRGRIRVLPDIAQLFSILVDESLGRARAHVTTALPLDEAQQQTLQEALQAYNNSAIHLYCEVDETILGGVIARIGSLRIDGSVRNRLQHLRETLLESAT